MNCRGASSTEFVQRNGGRTPSRRPVCFWANSFLTGGKPVVAHSLWLFSSSNDTHTYRSLLLPKWSRWVYWAIRIDRYLKSRALHEAKSTAGENERRDVDTRCNDALIWKLLETIFLGGVHARLRMKIRSPDCFSHLRLSGFPSLRSRSVVVRPANFQSDRMLEIT